MTEQQTDSGNLLANARELRALLLDFIAGGPTLAARYKTLRGSMLASEAIRAVLPPLLVEHENLDAFWQAMKYQLPSKVERQELIRRQFEPLMDALSGETRQAEGHFEAVTIEQLLKGWARLNQQPLEPRRRLHNGVSVLVQVCSSIIDAHYNSAEIRGGNTDLVEVFEMAKDVLFASSAGTDRQIMVADAVAGAAALLKSVEEVREQFTRTGLPETRQTILARSASDLSLSCAMSMLSCWHMLKDLHSQVA